jgi:hypothetical protein
MMQPRDVLGGNVERKPSAAPKVFATSVASDPNPDVRLRDRECLFAVVKEKTDFRQ